MALRQTLPLGLRFLGTAAEGQSCNKLLANGALFSSRATAGVAAESQEFAAAASKVAQFSAAEAEAMAAKKAHIGTGGLGGLGGLAARSTRAMSFATSKMFSSSAAPVATVAAAQEAAPSFFNRIAKAVAALMAAVALAVSAPAAADSPTPWQWSFQDMATSQGQAAVDLHHDVMFFCITVTVLVLYLVWQFATKFHYTKQAIPEKLLHHTTLEVIWTVFPTLIVLLIGIPSLTLIYSMDQQTEKPGLTVKVIGRQWYWSYEMHDHLQHRLVDPDRLVAIAAKSV